MRTLGLIVLLLVCPIVVGEEVMCGTSAEIDRALQRIDARTRTRIASNAAPRPIVRDGVVYLQADDRLVPGYHPLDLARTSLVFEPRDIAAVRAHKEALRYVAPSGQPVRDFALDTTTVAHDLPFSAHLFGREVTRIYVTAFNSIRLDPPLRDELGEQIDAADAVAHRQAVISPLLLTNHRPAGLAYPKVFIEDVAGAVIVTWRSSAAGAFAYDVQAEVHGDGTIVFSYAELTAISWGVPLITAGLTDDEGRELLGREDDAANDQVDPAGAARPMLDIRKLEVFRVDGSDVYSLRVTLGAPVQSWLLGAGETFTLVASAGMGGAAISIARDGTLTYEPLGGSRPVPPGASLHMQGNVIEFFGIQARHDGSDLGASAGVFLGIPSIEFGQVADAVYTSFDLSPAPRRIEADLSSLDTPRDLPLPVVEAFVLSEYSPWWVYRQLVSELALNNADTTAIATYQTFFTDLIFFAGAYATGGNAHDEGTGFSYSRYAPLAPTLLHMNQLDFRYNAAEATASKVLLHEFGHRWLYQVRIREDGRYSDVLAPLTAHPAAYVHTPSAFPLHGPDESSVMGGAFFTAQADGTYRAHAANAGYSWTDLYLMGLAAPQEVPPWFYLANSNPPLPLEYWPDEGVVVSAAKRDVGIDQMIAVMRPRLPSTETSSKHFKVVFVLVTEPGKDPTDAEMAKMNELRALFERDFFIATGGRASVSTKFAIPSKVRAVR